jgi:hypothetical protein
VDDTKRETTHKEVFGIVLDGGEEAMPPPAVQLHHHIEGTAGTRIRQGVTVRRDADGKYYPIKGEQP